MSYKGKICKGCGKYPVTHEKRGLCCTCRNMVQCYDCDLPAVAKGNYCKACDEKRIPAAEKAEEARDAVVEILTRYEAQISRGAVIVTVGGVTMEADLPDPGDDDDEDDIEEVLESECVGEEAK